MSNKNQTKNNPQVKVENTNTTAKFDLLELVKLAEQRKALEEQIKGQSATILAEIAANDAEIEKLHAKNVELRKLMGAAGINTGRGRPPMTEAEKAEAKAKREAAKAANSPVAPVNAEKTEVLNILNGVETGNNAPNVETMPQAETTAQNVAQVA